MDNSMLAFLLLLLFIFIARMINEKATKKLDQDQKAALMDLFSKDRIFTFGILIGIVVLFYLSVSFELIEYSLSFILYIILIFAFIIVSGYMSYKKLRDNNFPDSYIESYLFATSLRFIGILIFFALMKY